MLNVKQLIIPVLGALFLVMGCSDSNDDGNDGDTSGNGSGSGDTSGNGNNNGNTVGDTETPALDDLDTSDVCFDVEQGIGATTGRVMLLQDISSSMDDEVNGQTKWAIAQSALTNMVTTYGNSIEFGLDFFPIDTDCGVGTSVAQDAAPNNGDNLAGVLAATQLNRSTPLYDAMSNFLDASYAPAFMADGADPYLVVVSDGKDSCSNIEARDLENLTAQLLTNGIRTFVIGFGSEVDQDQLNAIAAAGGTGFNTYFDAQDETELNAALDSIGQAVVVSCRYQLGEIPDNANPAYTNIYFDGVGLTRGTTCTGEVDWIWGDAEMTTIQFCEDACTLLESGGVGQLNVIVMCNEDDVIVVVI